MKTALIWAVFLMVFATVAASGSSPDSVFSTFFVLLRSLEDYSVGISSFLYSLFVLFCFFLYRLSPFYVPIFVEFSYYLLLSALVLLEGV